MPANTEAPAPTSDVKQLTTKAAVFYLIIFILAYITNAMDRQIFPMMLPWIAKAHNFDLKLAGSLSTIFTLGLGLAGIPTGYLIDRWNRKTTLLIGMAVYSISTLLTIFALGFADMFAYRVVLGLGEAMQQAVLFAVVSSVFFRRKAMVLGITTEGFGIGSAIAPYVATRIVLATGDWRIPFMVFCGLSLVMTFVVWRLVPKLFTEHKGPVGSKAADKAATANIPESFWNRNSTLCAISIPFMGLVMFGYMGLYPTFLIKAMGFAPKVAAVAFSCYGLGCMCGIIGGWVGDRTSTRWTLVGAYICVMATTFLLFNAATQPWQHNVLSFLQGLFASSTLFPNNLALLQKSVKPEMVGRATGLFQVCHYSGGTVAGFLFAWLVGRLGWHTAALVQLTSFPIVGIVAMLLINNEQLFRPLPKVPNLAATANQR